MLAVAAFAFMAPAGRGTCHRCAFRMVAGGWTKEKMAELAAGGSRTTSSPEEQQALTDLKSGKGREFTAPFDSATVPPSLPLEWGTEPSPWTSAKASHILLKDAPYEDESAKARAAALIFEIEAGLQTFEEAAASLSHCPSGKRAGGSLGEFTPGRMVPPFDAAVFSEATQIGKLTFVETDHGVHVLRVDAREGFASCGCGWTAEKGLQLGGWKFLQVVTDGEAMGSADGASSQDPPLTAPSAPVLSSRNVMSDAATDAFDALDASPLQQLAQGIPTAPSYERSWDGMQEDLTRRGLAAPTTPTTASVPLPMSAEAARSWQVLGAQRQRAEAQLAAMARGEQLGRDDAVSLRASLALLIHTVADTLSM